MSILDCICNRGPTPETSCVGLTQLLTGENLTQDTLRLLLFEFTWWLYRH